MNEALRKILRKVPLTFKMVGLTVIVGLAVWAVFDDLATAKIEEAFEAHLNSMLAIQSQEDRLRFDHYVKSHHQVLKLFLDQKNFIDYIDAKDWSARDDVTVKYYTRHPSWFLKASILRTMAAPRFVILYDRWGRAREVYHRRSDPPPEQLLTPSELLIEKSRGQTHMAVVDSIPFMLSSGDIIDSGGLKRGTLLLASPIDDELLLFSQGDYPKRLVGLISSGSGTIITSNNLDLLPEGKRIEDIQDKYLITGKEFLDYGGAEMAVNFASFVSREEVDGIVRAFVFEGRLYRGAASVIFVLAFSLIMLRIASRIKLLTARVEKFSHEALGARGHHPARGDQLDILQERFQLLTEEVISSNEIIRRETEERAERKAELMRRISLSDLLSSVTDSLGVGVLARESEGFAAKNSQMERYLSMCGSAEAFELEELGDEERVITNIQGQKRIFHLTSPALSSSDKVILVRDVTEIKKLEEELLHAHKMKAIGTLTGGISHEFNNILTTIIGYGELLQDRLIGEPELKSYIDYIQSAALKAATLTRSLLAFSRKQVIQPRQVDLNEAVTKFGSMFSKLIGEDIELRTVLSDKSVLVMADPGQLDQVLINLSTNARDAMPQGGELTIGTDLRTLSAEKAGDIGLPPGPYVLLSVRDTGVGMDAATLKDIFEPFFTTKEVDEGTGLGLSMVLGIIKQHEGSVEVRSEPGKGTRFDIYLPFCVSCRPETEQPSGPGPSLPTGVETVLVAEDDEGVRMLTAEVLRKSGYRVISARNGEEALAMFDRNKDNVDMVLLDVTMPKKNGWQAYTDMRKIRPGLKALFISGYAGTDMLGRGLIEEGINYIRKPVSAEDLLRKIRETLDK